MARKVQGRELGVLSVAALGYLAERPMHAYEMYQLAMKRGEDRVVKISAGSLYRAVQVLKERGYAAEHDVYRDGYRPERTTFEITMAGRSVLDQSIAYMLATRTREYPEYLLALSEAHLLSRESVQAAVSERNQRLSDEIDEIDIVTKAAAESGIPLMYHLDRSLQRHLLEAEIGWNTELIRKLDTGDIPWVDDRPQEVRATAGNATPPREDPRQRDRNAATELWRLDNIEAALASKAWFAAQSQPGPHDTEPAAE